MNTECVRTSARERWTVASMALIAAASAFTGAGCASSPSSSDDDDEKNAAEATWQKDFDVEQRSFASTGRNRYFVLEPGFQLVLAGDDEELTITVLDETKQIDGVTTRVVEERETKDGQLVEVSRNYFAICTKTQDVFYFGEDVDVYKHGVVSSHPGEWHAGENGARAGIIMPGTLQTGTGFYQEQAPGKAMDRFEVASLTASLTTPAGTFDHCLKTRETNALKPKEEEFKLYAPDIGLIQDEDLLLIRYRPANGK